MESFTTLRSETTETNTIIYERRKKRTSGKKERKTQS
jgi:hypothetical protein